MSNCSEACSPVARRRSIRKARIRDPHEHNQREDSEGDAVEEVERLERAEVIGGSDDEARNRRAAAETEVACDSAKRDRGGALLRRDQGQGQNLVRGVRDSEPGAADGRADEGLPGTVDKCEACVAQCAREIAGDQDGFARKRSSSAPEGSVTTAAVPMTVASTSPAVAVGKPRAWCR